MLIGNGLLHGLGVALFALSLAACGSTTSGEGGSGGSTNTGGATGGTETGGAGTGGMATGGTGTGGTGGVPSSLANQGITQNDCAPNDGAAIQVRIGTASVCDLTANAAEQVWYLAYPSNLSTLAVGDTFDFTSGAGGNLSAMYFPGGSVGAQVQVTAGHLVVKSLPSTSEVEFDYSFSTETANFAGTAIVLKCDSSPMCG